ncbi:NAD-P-binding protein [Flammula alnicola]|nr:NAD-P-binding protein [Flammula alnicola]
MSSPKVWFITGASVGLGRATVEHVLEKGDKVVATLRKPSALSDLSAKYPASQLLVVKLDVTSPSDIKAAFAKAIEVFGRVDVVHNNAGYGSLGEIEGTPDEVARGVFEVNFWGSTNVAREAIHVFRDVNKPSGGRLLQASSMAGAQGMPGIGYYSASKHAVEGISEALSKELHPSWNIKVTILEIGGFATRGTSSDSLVTVPEHPAYTAPDSVTKFVRGYLSGPLDQGDSKKAAREIYNIAADNTVGLRVPLGLDAIGVVTGQLAEIKKDVDAAAKWSVDLK